MYYQSWAYNNSLLRFGFAQQGSQLSIHCRSVLLGNLLLAALLLVLVMRSKQQQQHQQNGASCKRLCGSTMSCPKTSVGRKAIVSIPKRKARFRCLVEFFCVDCLVPLCTGSSKVCKKDHVIRNIADISQKDVHNRYKTSMYVSDCPQRKNQQILLYRTQREKAMYSTRYIICHIPTT